LNLGADTPEGIALSIIAEIQAVLAGRGGGFLREWPGPIHAAPRESGQRRSAGTPGRARGEAVVCEIAAGEGSAGWMR
jgi:hypothetical protein